MIETGSKSALEGLRVVSFESRRGPEMAGLISHYGGEPFIAPSMREIPLGENRKALEFFTRLAAGGVDFLILLTGVGTRTLVAAVGERFSKEEITSALRKTSLVVRGPKPAGALRELGLSPDISVPEPNTWRDVLAELDSKAAIRGKRVAIQEYGAVNQELIDAIESRGAEVIRVPVYRWALPEDTGPLRSAIERLLDGQFDIAVFTNAIQVEHLFKLAREERSDQALRQSLGRVVIASIGPVCSEALRHFGLSADIEPDHPKMGYLVTSLARQARDLLRLKGRPH